MSFQEQTVPIGTSNTTILTCPVGQNGSVHGLVLSNLTNTSVSIELSLFNQSTGLTTQITSALTSVNPNDQFVWPRPINLSPGDQIIASASVANAIVAVASVYYNTGTQTIMGFNPRGTWSSTATYLTNDVVSYNGTSYVAISNNTNSQPPSGSWMVLASPATGGSSSGSSASLVNNPTNNFYVLQSTDAGNKIVNNTALPMWVVVPDTLPYNFECSFIQQSTGVIIVTPSPNVTINNVKGCGRYSTMRLGQILSMKYLNINNYSINVPGDELVLKNKPGYITIDQTTATYSVTGNIVTVTQNNHLLNSSMNGTNVYCVTSTGPCCSGLYTNLQVINSNTYTLTSNEYIPSTSTGTFGGTSQMNNNFQNSGNTLVIGGSGGTYTTIGNQITVTWAPITTTTATMSAATIGLISWTNHGLAAGAAIIIPSATQLPSVGGITLNTTYYVMTSNLTANTFAITTTPNGTTAISTNGGTTGAGITIQSSGLSPLYNGCNVMLQLVQALTNTSSGISGTTLTVNALTSGTLAIGQQLWATGMSGECFIVSGSGLSWQVSSTQSISGVSITAFTTNTYPNFQQPAGSSVLAGNAANTFTCNNYTSSPLVASGNLLAMNTITNASSQEVTVFHGLLPQETISSGGRLKIIIKSSSNASTAVRNILVRIGMSQPSHGQIIKKYIPVTGTGMASVTETILDLPIGSIGGVAENDTSEYTQGGDSSFDGSSINLVNFMLDFTQPQPIKISVNSASSGTDFICIHSISVEALRGDTNYACGKGGYIGVNLSGLEFGINATFVGTIVGSTLTINSGYNTHQPSTNNVLPVGSSVTWSGGSCTLTSRTSGFGNTQIWTVSNVVGTATSAQMIAIQGNTYAPTLSDYQYWLALGITKFRVPFIWELAVTNFTLSSALSSYWTNSVLPQIGIAASVSCSIILDCHNYAQFFGYDIGTTSSAFNPATTDLVSLWTNITNSIVALPGWNASTGIPGLAGFDLMNEPDSGVGVVAWQACMQAVVNAIRAIDTNGVIPLYIPGIGAATSTWLTQGSAGNQNFNVYDPFNNIIFTAHAYPDRYSSGTDTNYLTTSAGWNSDHEYSTVLYPNPIGFSQAGPYVESAFMQWIQQNGYGTYGMIGETGVPWSDDARWRTENLPYTLLYALSRGVPIFLWGGGTPWTNSSTYYFAIQSSSPSTPMPQIAAILSLITAYNT